MSWLVKSGEPLGITHRLHSSSEQYTELDTRSAGVLTISNRSRRRSARNVRVTLSWEKIVLLFWSKATTSSDEIPHPMSGWMTRMYRAVTRVSASTVPREAPSWTTSAAQTVLRSDARE